MIALVAQALSSKITLEDELEDARWFSRKEAIAIVNGTHDQIAQPFAKASSGVLLRNWALNK
jgi:NADH pyrophosphatase NudC (nudix superfamily)